MTSDGATGAPGLVDYLAVLWRRKWLFLVVLVIVPACSVGFSLRQTPTYGATANVLLKESSSTPGTSQAAPDPTRVAQTAAELARYRSIIEGTLRAVPRSGLTVDGFLKNSSVSASPGADLLTFSVTSTDPRLARLLASAYAHAFTSFELDDQTAALKQKLAGVATAISGLEARGVTGGSIHRRLVQERQDLTAAITLQTAPAIVRNEADEAFQLGPRTGRNGAIGVFLGLVLATMIVFLAETLDSRVRSTESLRHAWGLRVLGELSRPPRRLEKDGGLVMLEQPTSLEAEQFRVLRASLDLANSDTRARTIAITSAIGGEGKSTTAANLAIVLARAGRHVVLIDADLRNPSLHRLFGVAEVPGIVDVELGDAGLDDAMRRIVLPEPAGDGAVLGRRSGVLEMLPAGQALQNPDELGVGGAIARIADLIGERADVVLIDAPPLLPVGDTIALSAHVDGLLLVARLKLLTRSLVHKTRQVLETIPTAKLGLILADADAADGYSGYRLYGGGPQAPQRRSVGVSAPSAEPTTNGDAPAAAVTGEGERRDAR